MKLMSFNVRGLNAPFKRHALCSEIKRGDPDMVCLQETHFRRLSHPLLQVPRYTTQFHATGPTKSRGVSILLHDRMSFQLHRKLSDPKGRYLILGGRYLFVRGKIVDTVYTFASLYLPNKKQHTCLTRMLKSLDSFQQGITIIAGDLNVPLEPYIDSSSGASATPSIFLRQIPYPYMNTN
uniref:exodeoxyribonuclease III n=1 Tax=Leptobrachium leishanense TaxID=445787 RepID=A0A8C5Q6Z9_9ANUR